MMEQGRLDEGLKSWERARDLDPLSPFLGHLIAYAHLLKRDYPRALIAQRQANQLGPAFSTPQEVEIYIQNGAFAEALAEIDRLTPGRERDPICATAARYYLPLRTRRERLWRSPGNSNRRRHPTWCWRTSPPESTWWPASATAPWRG